VKLARLRRPKITCSPSYANIDLNLMQKFYWTWDTYPKERTCMGGIGKGKEIKNLNVVDVLTVEDRIQ
jgi:hypothetical protein